MPHAVITGIRGQDGSYLAELLVAHGYTVTGLARDGSADVAGPGTPDAVTVAEGDLRDADAVTIVDGDLRDADAVTIVEGDLRDADAVERLIAGTRPDEVYNLASPSVVHGADPVAVADTAATGTARLIDAVIRFTPEARLYQASSSELFGHPAEVPQTETTPFRPRSAYGAAKLHAHWLTVVARERHGIHASSGILYNHESPRRRPEFVTRRITRGAALVAHGVADVLTLGDLDARRDWGFAGDYVRAMWAMLQQPEPSDYIVCTGETHSVADVCEVAFARVGLDWRDHVCVDPALTRGDQRDVLVGDPSRARRRLGWEPTVSFTELVEMMVDADVARLSPTRHVT